MTVTSAKACDLPARSAPPPPGQALTGPAVTDLTGGAANHAFSLDGGRFSITPPPAGVVPRVSRAQAECEEQAAVGPEGEPLSLVDSRMAIGYGLVTVSPRLPVTPWQGHYPEISLPTPAAASYQSRLAWVLVIHVDEVASCPTRTSATAPATPRYDGYNYAAFIVDAAATRTGWNARRT